MHTFPPLFSDPLKYLLTSGAPIQIVAFSLGLTVILTEAEAGKLKDVFEAIRLAPSAVNKQPWRIVICGNKVHFYEKRSKGYVNEVGWDIQKIDMGIALCHFEVMAKECGLDVFLTIEEPSIPMQDEMQYIATYTIK